MHPVAYCRFVRFDDGSAVAEEVDANSIYLVEGTLQEAESAMTYQRTYPGIQERETSLGSDMPFSGQSSGARWAYRIDKVVIFYWQSGGASVRYVPLEEFNSSLLYFWTLHSVLPLKFSIEGTYTMLHAAAVEMASSAVLFLSLPFGGKSTLLESFIQAGYTMISDDKLPVAQHDALFLAVPSYPFCATERIPENLGNPVERFTEQPRPVAAVYVLNPVSAYEGIKIATLRGIEKFAALRSGMDFSLSFLKPAQFRFLHAFADAIPVYRIDIPRDKALLPEVRRRIEKHRAAADL